MIELLVALAILGILIIPIGSMVSEIINVNKKAQDNIKTAQLMNDMVEFAMNSGFNKNALYNHARNLHSMNPNFNFEYELSSVDSSRIGGIDNNKRDFNILIENDSLKVKSEKNSLDFNYINLNSNLENNIRIKAFYLDNKIIKYYIKNDTTNDEYSMEVDKPDFGVDFDDGSTSAKFNIYIDGVYDKDDKIIPNKFIVFRYKNNNPNVNIISQTPFVIISKIEANTFFSREESIIKTNIKIKDKNNKVIKEQVYYFTERLK